MKRLSDSSKKHTEERRGREEKVKGERGGIVVWRLWHARSCGKGEIGEREKDRGMLESGVVGKDSR